MVHASQKVIELLIYNICSRESTIKNIIKLRKYYINFFQSLTNFNSKSPTIEKNSIYETASVEEDSVG